MTKGNWLSRRTVNVGIAGGAIIGFLGLSSSFLANDPVTLVKRRVRHLFPGLEIDEESLQAFADDFWSRDQRSTGPQIAALRALGPLLYAPALRWFLPNGLDTKLTSFDRRIATAFVLSTDILAVQEEAGQRVSYIGYFDPYERPCGSPLALS